MLKTRWISLCLPLLLTAVSAAAQALPPGVTQVTTVEGVTEYRLPNGLQVLFVPDDAKPTTTVNMTYHVGSRHENYGETGMAHLLEHLMFKGTPTSQNLLGEFTRRGLRANGSTSQDRTNYFASFSANEENLHWYLGWQADAMVNSNIARKDLDTEMTVVRNELESGENNPFRVTLQKAMAAMFQWHNYGKSTIGARADVENVDIPRLQAFYRQYYQPDNATLIVAGKFDPMKTLAWIAESFAPIPKPTRVLPSRYTVDSAQDGERSVTVRRAGGSPIVMAGYHIPAGSAPDFSAAEALESVLSDAPSGRLHQRLVEAKLASSVFAFAWDLAEPGVMFVGAELAPGQEVDRARDEMLATVEGLSKQPVTAVELERARAQWLKNWELGFSDPERVGVALSAAIALGDWRFYFLQRDRMRELKLADVQRVAETWLVRDNRTLATFLPSDKTQRAPAPELVNVAAQVKDYKGDAAAAQAEAFDPTPVNLDARTQRFALASGLQVALLPKGTRGKVVSARLRLTYGDAKTLFGQETVASFVGSLLDKGTASLSRQQIRDRLDALRARLSLSADDQVLSAGIATTRENLPAVIELLGQLLREPAFPADALEELRSQALTAIEQQRKEPDALISNALDRHGNPYPRGDLRYASSFDESVEDVKAVKLESLRAFHRRFYSAASGEFGAAGDLDVAAVRAALEAAFGSWKAPADGALPFTRIARPRVEVKPERFIVKTPDKANANFRAIYALPLTDNDPDYPALTVANRIYGGDASSRLWKRLRDKEGFSYDVRTVIDWNAQEPNTRWEASAIFAPQNQPKVEAALREELERALKDGFTQAELDGTRSSLLNLRRLSRAQDATVAGQLVSNLYLKRDFALSQRVDDAIAALTLEQVNAAFRKYMLPANWSLAFGGDFKP